VTGSSKKRLLAKASLTVVLAALMVSPVVAGADYAPPVAGDQYGVQQTVSAGLVPGAEMMPVDFARDLDNNFWFAEHDWLNGLVSRIAVYDAAGGFIGSFGEGELMEPSAMEFSPDGQLLYVADAGNSRIAIFDPDTQTLVGQLPSDGVPGPTELSDPTAEPTRFSYPADLDFDAQGNLYVSDSTYNRVTVFNTGLEPVAQWGSGSPSSVEGGFDLPTGLFVTSDASPTVLVCDWNNHRVQRFSAAGTYIDSISQIDTDTAVYNPQDVFVDGYGVAYIAGLPQGAGGSGSFLRVSSAGEDLGEYSATPDGHLYVPTQLSVDEWGTVWINDRIYPFNGGPGALRAYLLNAGDPDLVPPVTTSNVSAGWTKGPANILLSAVDASTSVAATYYSLDNTEPHHAYTGTITVEATGTTTLKYASVDRVGNREATKTDYVRIDNQSPSSTSSVQPIYYGSAVVTFSAGDDLSGVQNMFWRLNGLGPYTDPSVYAAVPGTYTLEYYALDNAGNQEPSNYRTFVVTPPDSDPPLTSWEQNRGTEWFTEDTSITLNAVDTVSGVKATYLGIDGATPTTYTAPLNWSTEGTHTLAYYSVDLLDHIEQTRTASLKLDKGVPHSTAYAPVGMIGSATVTFEASDTVSGVERLEWRFDGTSTWTVGFEAPINDHGNYTLQYRAWDNAGNYENPPHYVQVEVIEPDYNAPTTIADIPAFGWVRGPDQLVLTASDDLSGIQATYYRVNGGSWQVYDPDTAWFNQGIYDIDWYSVDNQDNVETMHSGTLRVDETAPTTTSNALPFYSGPAEITLTSTDLQSGSVPRYRVDGGPEVIGYTINLTEYKNYQIEYWSVNYAGIEETPHHVINVAVAPPDTEPPITTFTGPTGWQKGSAQFSLSAWDASSTIKSTHYRTNGGIWLSYFSPVTVASEGTNTIDYYSIDFFNNVETSKTSQLLVDASPPVTTSDAIASYTDQAVVKFTPTDAYSGVWFTEYRINGGAWQTGTQAVVNWTRLRRYHTVEWRSYDNVNNIETIKSATFEVKLTSNSYGSSDSRIIYRDNWYSAYSGDVRESSTASDFALFSFQGTRLDLMSRRGPEMGQMRVTLLDTTMTPTIVDLYDNNERDGNSNSPNWTTGDIEFGDYVVKVERLSARVNIDDIRVDGSLIQVPDTAAPVTTVTSPTTLGVWGEGPVAVSLASTDATTGVRAIYVTSDGATPTVVNTYTAPVQVTSEGVNTVKYFAIDARGNTETVKAATVKIDNTPPVTNTNAQASYTGTASVALLPNDPHSGVAYTKYRIDDGAWTTGTAPTIAAGQLGSHTIEWYSVDNLGHVETTKSAAVTVLKRFEQTEPSVYWKGTWGTTTNAGLSGGSFKTSASSGAAAYLTFTGSQIDWITSRNTNYGKARLTLDGTDPVDVDLYGSFAFKQKVWTSGPIADGTHTLKIEYTGSKNASSTGYTIGVDAFDIVGELTPDTVAPVTTDDAPGAWRTTPVTVTLTATDANTWVGTSRYSANGGAATTYTAPFAVSGEGTTTIEYTSTDGAGNVETTRSTMVRIDRTAPIATADAPGGWVGSPAVVTLSATDAGSGVAQILYSTDGSEPTIPYSEALSVSTQGATTVRYKAVDTLGNTSSASSVTVTVDDSAPSVSASAPLDWSASPAIVTLTATDALSGVAEILYSTDGSDPQTVYESPITLTAGGTHVVTFLARDNRGNASSVDSRTIHVDSDAPTTSHNSPGSFVGTATITLSATDTASGVDFTEYRLDGAGWTRGTTVVTSTGGTHVLEFRSVDRVGNVEKTGEAQFTVTRRAEQTDGNLVFLGAWWNTNHANLSGGSFAQVSSIGGSANISFNGSRIAWVTSRASSYGKARVILDGGAPTEVDLYSPAAAFKQTVWTSPELPDGAHTLRIEYTGSKNASSTGYAIGLDALDVTGALIPADSIAPSTLASAPTGWQSRPVTVTLLATDNLSGVAATRYRVDDGADTTYSAPFAVSAEGPHTIHYWSVDKSGNAESPRTVEVMVDTAAPQSTDDAPLTWVSGPVNVTLNATDAHSGVASIAYSTDGSTPTVEATGHVVIDRQGSTILRYRATDGAGNTEPTRITTIRIDDDAPSTTMSATAGWANEPVEVTLVATDSASGVAHTYYSTDGSFPTIPYAGPITISTDGTTTVRYYSTDIKGNEEQAGFGTVSFDSVAPSTTTTAAASYPATSTIHFVANDDLSGVASTEYRLNGGEWTAGSAATLTPGKWVVDYRSSDHAGNTEAYKSHTVRVTVREEQTSSHLAFQGPWFVTNHVNLSGGSTKQVSAAGAAVTVAFDGARLDWITSKASSYGKARVIVDGGPATEVDLYSSSALFRQNVFTTGDLDSGIHTVRIEYAGSKNASSTGYTIGLDAVDVTGQLVQADRTAPVSSIVAPTTWQSKPTTVSLSAADDLTGVSAMYYRLDAGATTTYTAPFTVSGSAVHSVEYWAVDGVGNIEASRTRMINIDADAPVSSVVATASYSETATFTITAFDALSGVTGTQYRIDGGTWSTGSTATVSSGGPHTLEYRSMDQAGNVESTRSASFSITKRTEQTDSKMAWTGAWATTNHSGLSGGSFRSASTSSAALEFAFSGTSIDWITSRNTSYGKARVFLDGSDMGEVDLYGAFAFKQKVWSSGPLSNGAHTLRIQVLGSKNTSSTGYSVGVDAFDIVGSTTSLRYEQTSGLLNFEGTWAGGTSSSLSGGTHTVTSSNGSAVNVAFNGSSIDWIGSKSTSYGMARVTLDGTTTVDVDLYAATAFQQKLYSSGTLTNGPHTLRIEYLGSKNASSTGYTVGVDAFDIGGVLTQAVPPIPPGTRYEQTSSLLAFDGGWYTSTNSGLSGGSSTVINGDGSVSVAFTGSRLDWIATKATNYGIARVTVDGGAPVEVDLYGNFAFKQKVWTTGQLPEGPHTVKIEWTGSKRAASGGTYLNVDAFDVLGTMTQATSGPAMTRTEQDTPKIAYDGAWYQSSNPGLSGGTAANINTTGGRAVISFSGTKFDWIATKASNYGIALVSLDGGAPIEVDLYGSFAFKQKVWTTGIIADGSHTIEIEWTGTRNPASTGTYVNIDAVDVAGTLDQAIAGPPVVRHEETATALAYTGVWATANSASLSGGSWRSTNVTGAEMNVTFSGTRVDIIASKSINYGIAFISIDGGTPIEVDFYNPTAAFKQVVWSSGDLADGTHTLSFVVAGQRGTSSTGNTVGIDALDVQGTLLEP